MRVPPKTFHQANRDIQVRENLAAKKYSAAENLMPSSELELHSSQPLFFGNSVCGVAARVFSILKMRMAG